MMETEACTGADAPAAAPDGAIERLWRRSLLLLARDSSTIQDRLDLAELADAVGAPEIAQIARNTARLRAGFAPETASPLPAPEGSIDRAIAELRGLMTTGSAQIEGKTTDALDPTVACTALCDLLEKPLDGSAEAALAGLLAAWRGLADAPPADPYALVDAGLDHLISAFATRELQAFLQRNHDLAFAPFGSPRLLHAAARIGRGALGPYCSSIGNIVRSGQDVLGLIALAAGDEDATTAVERWVVPLSAHLHETIAIALADDLADLGFIGAVRGMLTAALRRTDRIALIRHLRDAAIDLGDLTLGISAQQSLLALVRFDAIEWRCIGALFATAGDSEGADAAFQYALKLAPGDAPTRAYLTALQAGDFGAFAVTGGFATPPFRQQIRFARRAA
jgi:hypothetical protein